MSSVASPTVVIEAERRVGASLSQAWKQRELLYFLVWRDLKLRYKQTAFGIAWAVLQPLTTMAVFSLFFGKLAQMPSDGAPYALFAFAALIPWTYFAAALGQGSNALVASQALVAKVYFPRILIPLASIVTPLADAVVSLLLLIVILVWFGSAPGISVVWLPLFALIGMASASGVGLLFAAVNVKYRDVRYVLPLVTQLWLFATPVAYPTSLVGEEWRWLYALNPMVTVIEGFRWSLLGTSVLDAPMVASSSAAAAIVLIAGLWYFRRLESTFADLV